MLQQSLELTPRKNELNMGLDSIQNYSIASPL